jgi:CPA2 family monovalent cation:H+ antiporter-2
VLKTLESKRRMGTLSSKVMIGVSIVQDLTVIPLMLLICKLDNLSSGLVSTIRPLALGAVFMFLMLTIGARFIPFLLRQVARFESKELFLFAVTGLALGIGLLSEAMQVSFSFGAFLAGIVLSESDYGKRALYEMTPVRDLFAMLFFVSIGMMLNVAYLLQNLPLVLLLMVVTSLSRTIFLAAVSWFSGYRNIIPIAMLFGMFATS